MKRPKPRLFSGIRDIFSADLLAKQSMIDKIKSVYELYGFVPLETPALEFVDVLGKFLPESNTPESGVFAFRNPEAHYSGHGGSEDDWLALRYDLTAPLARVVAQYEDLQRPFRRYQIGNVWRYEKPGPGRYREFCQFDFDSVGTDSMVADAEVCCVICDVLETIGLRKNEYIVNVNNRKIMKGILEVIKLSDTTFSEEQSVGMNVLQAIDKLDKIGWEGVRELLTTGRMDQSGDFTEGIGLEEWQVSLIQNFLEIKDLNRKEVCDRLKQLVATSITGCEGVEELIEIDILLRYLGYNENQVIFNPTTVRGLGYYTGPVFEGIITAEITDDKGQSRQFGSVFGGGRYDYLIERFTGQKVPATGASVGVDRLLEALKLLHRVETKASTSEILITVMDKEKVPEYLKITQELRKNAINAEVYLGSGSIKKQLKYADKLGIPLAIIAGSKEFEKGVVLIKDLRLGKELSSEISDRDDWLKSDKVQVEVKASELVLRIKEFLLKSNVK